MFAFLLLHTLHTQTLAVSLSAASISPSGQARPVALEAASLEDGGGLRSLRQTEFKHMEGAEGQQSASVAGPSANKICSSKPAYNQAQCEFIGCCTWTEGKCEGSELASCPTFPIWQTLATDSDICLRGWSQEECNFFGCCTYEGGSCTPARGGTACLDGMKLAGSLIPGIDATNCEGTTATTTRATAAPVPVPVPQRQARTATTATTARTTAAPVPVELPSMSTTASTTKFARTPTAATAATMSTMRPCERFQPANSTTQTTTGFPEVPLYYKKYPVPTSPPEPCDKEETTTTSSTEAAPEPCDAPAKPEFEVPFLQPLPRGPGKPEEPPTDTSPVVTKVVEPVVKPVDEPSKPSKPVDEPSKPVDEPSKPVDEPSKPVEQPENYAPLRKKTLPGTTFWVDLNYKVSPQSRTLPFTGQRQ